MQRELWNMGTVEDLLYYLLVEGLWGGVESIMQIAMILFPVLLVIEFARYYKIIERISQKMEPMMNFLTLPKEAAFPLVAGLGFGVVFGAALIIDYAREGLLNKRGLMLVGIFLSINHSVVEDTLVFTALGANPVVILGARFFMAVLVTRIAAALIDRFSNDSTLLSSSSSETSGSYQKKSS